MTTPTNAPQAPRYTKKDFESDQDVRWCPGCGDYAILSTIQKMMPDLGVPREDVVFVSGIGCSSRFPYYMNTYGFHTIHGRAPAIATGLRLARPDLKVFVVTGDGDGLSIGGNHMLHVLRRNVNLTILLFNNRIYGLTKGQYSPTSELGKVTKSTPLGSTDRPINPCAFALGVGATFVARTVDRNIAHMEETLKRAAAHRGAAFVEILQNCNIYNDLAWNILYDRESKIQHELRVEHGKPLLFGPADDRRGLVLDGVKARVVQASEVPAERLWVHDQADIASALVLANLPDAPVPDPDRRPGPGRGADLRGPDRRPGEAGRVRSGSGRHRAAPDVRRHLDDPLSDSIAIPGAPEPPPGAPASPPTGRRPIEPGPPSVTMDRRLLDALREIVGPDGVVAAADQRLVYECDMLVYYKGMPDLVALPRSTAEVVAVVRRCLEAGVPDRRRAARAPA